MSFSSVSLHCTPLARVQCWCLVCVKVEVTSDSAATRNPDGRDETVQLELGVVVLRDTGLIPPRSINAQRRDHKCVAARAETVRGNTIIFIALRPK